jgi:hypothetical protein
MTAAAASGRLAAKKIRNATNSQMSIFLTTPVNTPRCCVDTHRNSEYHFFGVLPAKGQRQAPGRLPAHPPLRVADYLIVYESP